jgi:hypothetical protein
MSRPVAYNFRNCQSLFGYAADVHKRSGGTCQLCDCGRTPIDFDLWRQMTVEHLIGRSQGGYLKQIREAVAKRFSDLPSQEQESLSRSIDALNTVTACSFCNSTTSRDACPASMTDLIASTPGTPNDLLAHLTQELGKVLARKREDVAWKLHSVRVAFQQEFSAAGGSGA